ncbi:MAG: alpha/beta hydrolase [Myxococcales bacterium]|nr:alpha/beta hydrolase [Myxococcales bacterium]
MTLSEWRIGAHTHKYRGHDIAYWTEGEGDALLLIHGFPTAAWDWNRLWDALTKRFRVVVCDMLGFGFSAKPLPYDYSILDQARLQEELLAALGIEGVHILAHDYGDTVAQELLAARLDRDRDRERGLEIRSVTLLNGGLFPETHRARPIQKLLASPLGPLLVATMSERRFSRSFARVFGPRTQPSATEMRDFWELASAGGGLRVMPKLLGYMRDRARHRERWVGALRETGVPLRLINGPADPVSGSHMADRYQELVPNADVVRLGAEIGHYPQVEDPEGVLRAFLAFIDRLS